MYATANFVIPINGYFIVLFERIDKMFSMKAANDIGSEIVNDKAKEDRACEMLKETGCVTSGDVSICSQMCDEFFVGHSASLW